MRSYDNCGKSLASKSPYRVNAESISKNWSNQARLIPDLCDNCVATGKRPPDPNSIEITCDSLILKDKSLSINLDLTNGFQNFEKIIINGEVFVNQRFKAVNNINTWRIIGYIGFSDRYEGPESDNLDITIKVDKLITKDEIIAMLKAKFNWYRFTVFKLYLLEDTDR